MYGTILQQGSFTAIAAPYTLKLRSDLDWLKVYDPVSANDAAAVGFEYFWQRGFAPGTGSILFHAGAATVVSSGFLVAPLGFTLINSSTFAPSAPVAVGAGDNAAQITYTCALGGVSVGSIVRVYLTAQNNMNSLDFSVGAIPGGGQFQMRAALQQVPGIIAGANGFARLIADNVDDYNRIYPSRRVIANITQDVNPTVTTLVDHSLTVGQQLRINVPDICNMTQLNGQLATVVTVVDACNFTINIDTTSYTAFRFPTSAQVGANGSWTPAEAVPLGGFAGTFAGQLPAYNNQSIVAATTDNDYIGIKLGYDPAGTGLAPAGIAGHTMYWIAGKSVNV